MSSLQNVQPLAMSSPQPLSAIPRPPVPTVARARRLAKTRRLFFTDGVFPDADIIQQHLLQIVPSSHDLYLAALATLLPEGWLTPDAVELIGDLMGEIYDQLKSQDLQDLNTPEIALYVGQMPSNAAGLYFLHLYNHWFKGHVSGIDWPGKDQRTDLSNRLC
jgi:hypothetical protein